MAFAVRKYKISGPKGNPVEVVIRGKSNDGVFTKKVVRKVFWPEGCKVDSERRGRGSELFL